MDGNCASFVILLVEVERDVVFLPHTLAPVPETSLLIDNKLHDGFWCSRR
jgi:hypothetical protein